MGGHRTRKVRTLAPGPEGTEKLRMTRRNVIERFGGCVSAQAECVYRKKYVGNCKTKFCNQHEGHRKLKIE